MPRRGHPAELILLVLLVSFVAACSGGSTATQALPTLGRSIAPASGLPLLVITPPPASASAAPSASATAVPSVAPTPSPSPSPTAVPSASVAPTPVPSESTAPSPTTAPSVSPTAALACTPQAPTAASATWQAITTRIATFQVSVPPDWVDRSAGISVRAGDYFDAASLQEAGAGLEDGLAADARSGPGTAIQNPNFRVVALPGIAPAMDVLAARVLALYTGSNNQITDENVTACVGGEEARGIQLLYHSGASYAEILAVEHEGATYMIEWIADAASIQNATFAEILRTWSWVPGAGPPPDPSPAPSASPSASPTPEPTATPVPSPSEEAFPNDNESKILDHVPSAIRASCARVKAIYDRETDSVHCTPDGQPMTDYSLFRTASLMNAAYKADMETFNNPTKNSKGCLSGDYESSYTVDGDPNGRWACVVDDKKNKTIEWTDDTNLILTYAWSNKLTWQEMYDYWFNDAGPIN